jgi:hypothetical protein
MLAAEGCVQAAWQHTQAIAQLAHRGRLVTVPPKEVSGTFDDFVVVERSGSATWRHAAIISEFLTYRPTTSTVFLVNRS